MTQAASMTDAASTITRDLLPPRFSFELEIERAKLTMLAAAKAIAVPSEPTVEPLCQRPNERDREHPGDEFPLRELIDDLFDRRCALPRVPVTTNQLHGLREGARRYPREAGMDSGRLRRHDPEHAMT